MISIFRFTAPWCVPCRLIAPFFESFIREYPDVNFFTYDASDPLPEGIGPVTIVPTVVAVRDGKEISRIVGPQNKKTYEKFIDEHRVSG